MKVLVVEDSPEIVEVISICLEVRWPGFKLLTTEFGAKAAELVEKESPDIVILDISLPDMEGFEVLKDIRRFSSVPVVILTVRGDEIDKVRGLELGADDYIAKPFSPIEFLARVKAVLRRSHMPELVGEQQVLQAGPLAIDLTAHQATLYSQPLKLTPIEYGLLCQLVRNEGKMLTHRMLLENVWGEEYGDAIDYVKKYIHRLRQKLGDDLTQPRIILSERGVGYRFLRPGP